jgi:hypothetical protein
MWMLVIVLLDAVPGIPTVTVLQTYPTSQECRSERERIGDEMAKAYPDERDFEISCHLKAKRDELTRMGCPLILGPGMIGLNRDRMEYLIRVIEQNM